MSWNKFVWEQFGAAIDMLDDALLACPESLWEQPLYDEPMVRSEFTQFWYVAYHALFWLDFYLADSAETFTPPAPFTQSELQSGQSPERTYTKAELCRYLQHCRNRCKTKLETLTDLHTPQRVRPNWTITTEAELMLYNMRHVQEHAAQLSLFLGQQVGSAPGWVGRVRPTKADA